MSDRSSRAARDRGGLRINVPVFAAAASLPGTQLSSQRAKYYTNNTVELKQHNVQTAYTPVMDVTGATQMLILKNKVIIYLLKFLINYYYLY